MEYSDVLKDWQTRKCVLATMHGKEKVIAPVLKDELGIAVFVPENFNTDVFGTFTREIKRTGDQLAAARAKAQAAMKMTGADLAVVSEGSYGIHPDIPFIPSGLELLLLIDEKNDLEIKGHYRTTNLPLHGKEVSTIADALATARSWGFPEQGVIVRQSQKSNKHIHKDIHTEADFTHACEQLLSKWYVRSVYLETDMRAHRCPARMSAIEAAAKDLVHNCKSLCPKCSAPGFVVTDVVRGLPCSVCQLPTDSIKEYVYGCKKCQQQESKSNNKELSANPAKCTNCNP